VKITVNCTTNSIYVNSITVTAAAGAAYSDYSLVCGPAGPPASYTIRFFNNGEQIGEDQVVEKGQQPEVPANPAPACEEYTFAGWWTEELAADNTTAKAWVTNFKVTKDQNYYAIYSKTEEGEGAAFDGTNGGIFKIYSQTATTAYYAINSINSSNKLETSTKEADAADFTFEKVTDGFTIKTDGKYLAYGGSSTNVKLQADAYVWTISASTAGVGTWRVIASTATTRALALRETETFQTFGAYATSNIKANSEYYDVEIGGGTGSVTYYSSIETCSETAIENMEIVPTAVKAIRNGQLVIIRGNAVYSVTGARIQ
jgi:hypothetical protein